jgi:Tfp pilus assembly protein PilO
MTSLTRIIIIGLITLATMGGLGYEVYLISSIQNEVTSTNESTDLQVGSDSRAKNIALLQESARAEVKMIEEVLLTRSDLVSLVEKLEKTGRDLGLNVSISSITNDSKTSSSVNPETVRISIEARGSWAPSLSYVRLIENLPHKFSVEKVDIGTDGEGWRTLISLKLITYPER